MVNLRRFFYLASGALVASPGCKAQTNASTLTDIVPKREVLYVGGQYINMAASVEFPAGMGQDGDAYDCL